MTERDVQKLLQELDQVRSQVLMFEAHLPEMLEGAKARTKAHLLAFEESFPELPHKFMGFKKFCIAFMIAEQIVDGKVRNRLEKEALKHVLCMKFNAQKAAPSDSFIREIAINVLGAEEFEVNSALKIENIELA